MRNRGNHQAQQPSLIYHTRLQAVSTVDLRRGTVQEDLECLAHREYQADLVSQSLQVGLALLEILVLPATAKRTKSKTVTA